MASEDKEQGGSLAELAPEDEKTTTETATSHIDPDAMLSRLEELLSKQSLSEDAFVQQHMNAQMYIPLTVLCLHHSLRSLGTEASVLAAAQAAAQKSDKVAFDEETNMVKPLLKARRNTLILHGLPDEFPEEELQQLFNGSPEGDSFVSLKPDVNNTAFVSFKTDEAAQNAALWLRSQKFQGNDIKCSMKSEQFVRSFFPAANQANSPFAMPGSAPQYQAWGYPGQNWTPGNMGWNPNGQGGEFSDPNMAWGDQNSFSKGDGKGKSPKSKGKGRKRGSLGGSFSQSDASQMESGSDFNSPQLGATGSETGINEGLVEPGYTHEYRKYSRQYIIEVCNAMDEIIKPESYDKCENGENPVALFRSSPCKDWAPLPTPMVTFASNFFDDKRGSVDTNASMDAEGDGKGQGKGDRSSRKDSDWSQGDSSWGKSGSGKGRKSWGAKGGWEKDGGWQTDAGYSDKPQWVKKEDKAEKEASSSEWDDAGQRKMSWADKVKEAGTTDRAQKWVAKPKQADDAKAKEDGTAAAADGVDAVPTATVNSEAAGGASLSWADKVRAGATKK